MTCTERQDQILLLAADALEPAERDEVRAHLAGGCPVCHGYLAEAQAVMAELPKALPVMAPPAGARERLMDRVAAGLEEDRRAPATIKLPTTVAAPVVTRTRVAWWPAAIAAAVAVAVGGVAFTNVNKLRDTNAALTSQLAAKNEQVAKAEARAGDLSQQVAVKDDELTKQDQRIIRLQEQLRTTTETVDFLRSPNLLLVEVPGTPDAPKAKMTILRDRSNTRWLVVAGGLEPLAADRTYQLWFITPDERKLPAGTFAVDARGSGSMLVNVPRDVRIIVTAVTDEPAGGSAQPTGKIRIAGPPEPRPAT